MLIGVEQLEEWILRKSVLDTRPGWWAVSFSTYHKAGVKERSEGGNLVAA